MKKGNTVLFSSLVIVFLTTNFTVEASVEAMSNEQINIDMKIEVITEKFKKNGHKLLCNQEEYRKCFKISQEKCFKDINQINDSCIEYSKNKIGEIDDLKERPKKYGKIYATCLTMKHFMQYTQSTVDLQQCLETVKIDKVKVKKTALE